jgi:hypothetical protein
MSEHTLPDDFSRWPLNPFELLGVQPGVSDRDLRRAYVRLIRIYKPEQFPEHFRRIREAYETARRYAQFYTAFQASGDSSDLPPQNPPPTPDRTVVPEADNVSMPAAQGHVSLPCPLEEELDEAWSWAVDGDEARAYARLLDLHNRYPERSEICLRLYSLLSVAPELDTQHVPCDFLVHGLRQTCGRGPGHELYRREINDNPAEALTVRFAKLLNTTIPSGLLTTFVQWRWGAAGHLGRFEVIGNDLPGLRPRLAEDQEEIWLRLLAYAADQLAWAPASTKSLGFPECLNEIAQLNGLQLRCPDVFDRLENLEQVVAGWNSLRKKDKVPAHFLELMRHYWIRPFSEIRPTFIDLLAAVVAEAELWLGYLDRMARASPNMLSLFGQMLDSYEWTLNQEADSREPMELAVLARHFLEEHHRRGYSRLRRRLLAFCLRELINPDLVAELAINETVVLPQSILNLFWD